MKDLTMIVAENLSALRKARGLTQGQLAEMLSYSGKSISKWETGGGLPDVETLDKLASFYGVTLDYLTNEHPDSVLQETGKHDPESVMRNKLIIAVLGVVFVWTVAAVTYSALILCGVQNWQSWLIFVWAIPASFLTILFFNQKWGYRNWGLAFLISFFWTAAIASYLEVGMDLGAMGWRLWFLLLTPIPCTVGAVLVYRFRLDSKSASR